MESRIIESQAVSSQARRWLASLSKGRYLPLTLGMGTERAPCAGGGMVWQPGAAGKLPLDGKLKKKKKKLIRESKRGGHGLGETTPERAPPPPQVQRTGRAGRQRHKPPSYDSSPAASASRRPSFSPRGSTADPCSAAEAAVRETEICAPPSAQFRSSRCAHAASAKPLRLFIALWV